MNLIFRRMPASIRAHRQEFQLAISNKRTIKRSFPADGSDFLLTFFQVFSNIKPCKAIDAGLKDEKSQGGEDMRMK
jgi:hypothetical protein